jgi:hypothetical protein
MKTRFTIATLAAAVALMALPATSHATFKKGHGYGAPRVAAAAVVAPAAPRKDWLADHFAKKQALWAQKTAAWNQMWAQKRAAWDQMWAQKMAFWQQKKAMFHKTAAAAPAPAPVVAPAKAPRRPLK